MESSALRSREPLPPPSAPPAPAPDAPAPDAEEPDAPAPAPAPTPSETPDQIDAEHQALWERAQPRRRWYQARLLHVAGVLAALLSALALIPYPLRITSEATIIPAARAYVRSPIAGELAEILVDEGSAVHQGDVIAKLDDRDLVAERRKAVAEALRITSELDRLRHGARREEIAEQRAVVEARRTAVEFATKEAARRAQMAQDGVGSRQALEDAQLDLEVKHNAAAEANAALALIESGSRPEEIAAHEARLARAKAELAFIDQKLADMVVIRAPIDGVVLTPKFRERLTEHVEAGGLVCEIANSERVRAEIFVPERNADTIGVGMPVEVKVESYPLQPFAGEVGFIAPAIEARDKINVVRVVATLDNHDHLLRQDMTGYGEIECGRRSLLDLATRRLLRWIRVRFLL